MHKIFASCFSMVSYKQVDRWSHACLLNSVYNIRNIKVHPIELTISWRHTFHVKLKYPIHKQFYFNSDKLVAMLSIIYNFVSKLEKILAQGQFKPSSYLFLVNTLSMTSLSMSHYTNELDRSSSIYASPLLPKSFIKAGFLHLLWN